VTLPLAVLSATFHWMIPLALTSLAVSLGVCIAAGAQAELPETSGDTGRGDGGAAVLSAADSAGMGALRGPAGPAAVPQAARETLDSVALREGDDLLNQACYFWGHGPDRVCDRRIGAAGRAGLAQQIRHGLERVRCGGAGQPVGASATDHSGGGVSQGKENDPVPAASGVVAAARAVFWSALGLELLVIGFAGRGCRSSGCCC